MTTADQINLLIAVATAGSTLASVCVVYLTLQILGANRTAVQVMQAQLESVTRPNILVVAAARPMTTFFELSISNSGNSPASNLRLSLDKDYYFNAEAAESANIRRYDAFVHSIDSFPPRAQLVFGLGAGFRVLESDLSPLRFKVTAEYDWSGRHYVEHTNVDMQPFKKSLQITDAQAEGLERIAKAIETFSERDAA